MQYVNLKTLTLTSAFSLALCASPAWSACKYKNDKVKPTTPDSHFTDNKDGTVTHHKTGLMWKMCSEGQTFKMDNGKPTCTGTANQYNWNLALERAESSRFANKSDWRLPNINELASIVALDCQGALVNVGVFPGIGDDRYWSSSPNMASADEVRVINFDSGGDDVKPKTVLLYVHLVRNK